MSTIVKKAEVIEKLETLMEYSCDAYEKYYEQQPHEGTSYEEHVDVSELFEPFGNILNEFFDPQDLTNAVQSVLGTLKCDLIRRSTRFEKDVNFGFPTDYPNGYENFVQFAYNFDELMKISNEEFYNGFYWTSETIEPESSETSSISETEEPDTTDATPITIKKLTGNTFLDKWITEIPSEKARECDDLLTVANWCKNAIGNYFVLCQTENFGNITSKMDDKDAWIDIYINRGLYELIKGRELGNNIPSCVKETLK